MRKWEDKVSRRKKTVKDKKKENSGPTWVYLEKKETGKKRENETEEENKEEREDQ